MGWDGMGQAGVPIFVEHWGDNLQFYPNFSIFSTLGGMNLDHDFVQVSKLKNRRLFFPNSSEDQTAAPNIIQRSDADQSQIIGGDADVDDSQIIGGDISSHSPGFGNPGDRHELLWNGMG